jgi:hypothetical protein
VRDAKIHCRFEENIVKQLMIDIENLAFDAFGRQVGVEVPADLLNQVSGGANKECGTGCQGSDNGTCGNRCREESPESF